MCVVFSLKCVIRLNLKRVCGGLELESRLGKLHLYQAGSRKTLHILIILDNFLNDIGIMLESDF